MSELTLSEIKKFLREHCFEGTNCPACTQRVHVRKFKLLGSSVYALWLLYKYDKEYPDQKWFHVKKIAEADRNRIRASHFAELRYMKDEKGWGLIEEKINTDTNKRCSGYWGITNRGKDFMEGLLKVPKYIILFNGKCIGFQGEKIGMREALGNQFNYEEMMNEQINYIQPTFI